MTNMHHIKFTVLKLCRPNLICSLHQIQAYILRMRAGGKCTAHPSRRRLILSAMSLYKSENVNEGLIVDTR